MPGVECVTTAIGQLAEVSNRDLVDPVDLIGDDPDQVAERIAITRRHPEWSPGPG